MTSYLFALGMYLRCNLTLRPERKRAAPQGAAPVNRFAGRSYAAALSCFTLKIAETALSAKS
jgi:hypothetical protein